MEGRSEVAGRRGPVYATREERQRRMFYIAQGLVLTFGVFLIIMGGAGSLTKFENTTEMAAVGKFTSPTEAHHYAVAFHNMLLGLLFVICSIGLYVPVWWARELTFASCIIYVADTIALTVWEYVVRIDAYLTEAFADVIFWSVVPVIIVVLLLVSTGGAKGPTEQGKATC